MRPAEVADEDIIAAGDHLLAQGKKVTGWVIRTALGGKGNPRRLFEVWQRHAAGESAGEHVEPAVLPVSVQDMATAMQEQLSVLLSRAWLSMYREIDMAVAMRYQAERQQLDETRAAYEEEMAGANAAIEVADQHEAELLEQLAVQQVAVSDARLEQVRLDERCQAAQTRETLLSGRVAELEEQLTQARAEGIRLSERLQVAEAERDDQQSRLEAAQSQSAHARLAASTQEAAAKAARSDAVDARQAHERTVRELASAGAQLADAQRQAATDREQVSAIKQELERERDERRSADALLKQMTGDLLQHNGAPTSRPRAQKAKDASPADDQSASSPRV